LALPPAPRGMCVRAMLQRQLLARSRRAPAKEAPTRAMPANRPRRQRDHRRKLRPHPPKRPLARQGRRAGRGRKSLHLTQVQSASSSSSHS
ncbi:unnamed protein product, partial [Symbiodinium sp. CCMP2456]